MKTMKQVRELAYDRAGLNRAPDFYSAAIELGESPAESKILETKLKNRIMQERRTRGLI